MRPPKPGPRRQGVTPTGDLKPYPPRPVAPRHRDYVTTIPCPDSNTIAGDCAGHLDMTWDAGAEVWRFVCGECGRPAGIAMPRRREG